MTKTTALLRHIMHRYTPAVRLRGKELKHFADKLGFVYFGSVDQRQEDVTIIRGLTVSSSHYDTHYSIGSFNDYDIAIADRFDVVTNPHQSVTEHSWLIFQIDIRHRELPHMFFKPKGHSPAAYNRFFTAYHQLSHLNESLYHQFSQEFHTRYELYGLASRTYEIEHFITPQITQTMAAHFWPHAVEIYDGKLYVYITEHRLDQAMLDATLQSATWLADMLR